MKKYELVWRKIDGTLVNDVVDYTKKWLEKWPNGTITIGCDSQEHTNYIKYSVTLNMHMIDTNGIGRGGHIIIANVIDKDKNMKSDLFTKLWAEAELTVAAAQAFEGFDSKIIIHLDYNSDEKEYSNILYNSGLGFVKGMGYEVKGKPFAWASSHSADAFCKNKQGKKVKSETVKGK